MRTSLPAWLLVALAAAAPSRAAAPTPSAPAARPNVVVIMLDDLGYSDLGCYGGEIRTPNIDRIAAEGVRFSRFYNASRCCPTRAAMLTGLYPHQVGLAHNGRDLSRDGATIAEVLRTGGYQTAMVGKWHLSATKPLGGRDDSPEHLAWLNHHADFDRPFADPATYPINRGFDSHYGSIWGVIDHFDPFSLVEGTEPVRVVPKDYYMTDAINARSVEAIRQMSGKDQPFFLYVAHNAPHWPLHARPEDIARYRGRYDDGWHALRQERYRRQVALGLVDPARSPLPPIQGNGPDWEALSPADRAQESALMAVHAAMVDRVDQGVGAILGALRDAGKLDNTLILVLADNGASPERYTRIGFDRSSETRDGRPIQYTGRLENPGSETTWGYIGSHWASAANTPLRYWKVEAFDGGCRTPLVVRWPAGVTAPAGSISNQLGHVIDLMPTCLEVAATPYPREYAGHPILPLEGRSLVPAFRGGPIDESKDRPLFFEHEGGRAVIAGDWKLVAPRGKGQGWQLYHVSEDATETRDVARDHPERVADLSARWVAWARRVGAEIPADLAASSPTKSQGIDRELHPGEVLVGDQAPMIAGAGLRVEATVRDAARGGVIVSQGGQVQGWSLHVRDGRTVFAVRRDRRLRELVADRPIAAEAQVTAQLAPDGTASIQVDGQTVAQGNLGGPVTSQPTDPLIVGDDRLSAVGDYETPRPFLGTILRARLSVLDP